MFKYVLAFTVWGALDKVYKRHGKGAGPVYVDRCFMPVVWRYELLRDED